MTPMALARTLFDRLRAASLDPPGVTRASYSREEQAAHDIVAEAARGLGLEVSVDEVGTLRMLLPGREPGLAPLALGSHLDSVPHGGNFDGAAGVVLGLAAASALRAPRRSLLLLGIRAEEMCWFPMSYLGSKALFGLLPADAGETLRRADTGRSLASHMAELGFGAAAIRARRPLLDPRTLHGFLEPHIEQGPVLEAEGIPLGIVTGIRGSRRWPRAMVSGEHAHAGAVPRAHRRDAGLAAAALLAALDRRWQGLEAEGKDLVVTAGIIATDPGQHAPTKVPGLLRFSLDLRSEDAALLEELEAWLRAEIARLEAERGVRFDLGPAAHTAPAAMDARLMRALEEAAAAEGVPARRIVSGAGHDCATFASLGVPSAMLFLRNQNGSHNPDEALRMEDAEAAVRVLARALAELLA